MKVFSQKRYFTVRQIEFFEKHICYSKGNLIGQQKFIIPYDDILYDKPFEETKITKFDLVICIISGLIALKSFAGYLKDPDSMAKGLLPVATIIFIAFLISTLLSKRRIIYIPTISMGSIELFENVPSEEEVHNVIEKIEIRSKAFLRKKYSSIDKDLPLERQLESLNWLLQKNILEENEYKELKQQLLGRTSEVKGFNQQL